jgi:hypothetical protein
MLLLLQNWSSTFGKDIINCKSNQARMSRCDDTLWILVACNCWNQGQLTIGSNEYQARISLDVMPCAFLQLVVARAKGQLNVDS